MSKFKKNTLLFFTFLAVVVAMFDYVVRTYTLGWTEAVISQGIVFFSPVVYFMLLILILFKLRISVLGLTKRSVNISTVLLFLYSTLLLVQVYSRHQGVGSASYSIVSPLFISGVPMSVLTFLLYFRKSRGRVSSFLVCLVSIFWLLMPMGIDALYVNQGGYRGPSNFQFAVISTSYDFIQFIAAFGIFLVIIIKPAAVLISLYCAVKAKGIDRIYSLAVGISIVALSIQFANWGGFVWD